MLVLMTSVKAGRGPTARACPIGPVSYHRPRCQATMTANDDTPAEGQESIEWEEIGKDALASLLDHHRMETAEPCHRVVDDMRAGKEPSEEDLRELVEAIEGYHSVVESIVVDHLMDREPARW